MPPEDSGDSLPTSEVDRIRKRIDAGAPWQGHWAFEPLHSAIPVVQRSNWSTNPIDHFVLAKLEAKGLDPVRRADRYTLIRRLSFDLNGLPPRREQVMRFVGDHRPDAYEYLVDRMLALLR